jgi:hypothetical protein
MLSERCWGLREDAGCASPAGAVCCHQCTGDQLRQHWKQRCWLLAANSQSCCCCCCCCVISILHDNLLSTHCYTNSTNKLCSFWVYVQPLEPHNIMMYLASSFGRLVPAAARMWPHCQAVATLLALALCTLSETLCTTCPMFATLLLHPTALRWTA